MRFTRLKIFVGQVYIKLGINYPFSHVFQRRMHEILSGLVQPSEEFDRRYGNDFNVMFNLSAKRDISTPEIVGPAVYKKTKDVEYTIFLPHDGSDANELGDYAKPIRDFLVSVSDALKRLELDATEVNKNTDAIIKEITLDPAMFKKRSRPI